MSDQDPTPLDDDTEGHTGGFTFADAERDETGDDVEGRGGPRASAEPDDGDDVAGHLSGALGAKKRDG